MSTRQSECKKFENIYDPHMCNSFIKYKLFCTDRSQKTLEMAHLDIRLLEILLFIIILHNIL